MRPSRRGVIAGVSAGAIATLVAPSVRAQKTSVDVLLVLAVDVSRSIDEEEARLQRQGYVTAMADPRVVAAIRSGTLGAIAVAYVEWGSADYQRLVIPWTRIDGEASARAWVAALDAAPRVSMNWTSISGAIEFSMRVLDEAPFEGTRRVIDISGDGVNNSGAPVTLLRDLAVEAGITINGLPILNDRSPFGRPPSMPLDQYFQDFVIGGPGAFMVPAEDFNAFQNAVLRKLIREISVHPPAWATG
ncbi:DUF1194 domain-containing protein [Elioraea sp. Yellowstone]|jgi:hypothetical protein|uniref:DUF1194 domain-containing protein n=1 Tax=Elioraea sp. Yellowstone TaxID=2592070 RepID=UPI00114D5052|nr:DUF1194 domain-containing protein [Elioraea sp. Yellowstone]TQF76423.1 DUF1194 domain-containing protein [Elioraea sp. Yellowstone]